MNYINNVLPKKKAIILFNKAFEATNPYSKEIYRKRTAKRLVEILIDEILDQDEKVFDPTEAQYHMSYWMNVKDELFKI